MAHLGEWFTMTEDFKKHLKKLQIRLTMRTFGVSYAYDDFWKHPNCVAVLVILNHIVLCGYEGWVDG